MSASLKDRFRLAVKVATGQYDENAATAAFGLLAGVMPGGIGTPPVRGTREYLRAYGQMPWLRAVTARIATAVASAEWQVFVVRKGGKVVRERTIQRSTDCTKRRLLMKQAADADQLEQVADHPLLDMLNDANSFQTGIAMRKVTQLHLDLVGEAFWLKERDGLGNVIGVWPIPPDWILSTPTPTARTYRVQYRAWRGTIPDTEFIWFSDPDPWNPYARGSGTAQALGDDMETDKYAARHTKAFFYNRARPDIIVWPKEGRLMGEQVKRLEEEWVAKSQGFWRAFKPYFLAKEVGIKELEQNFRSQQLVPLREFERDTIIHTFGIPPELLGVIENSNRATIDAADFLMAKYVTLPRLEFIRSVMQERLVPEYDENIIVEFVSPVQEDKEFQLKAATAAPWSLSADEWRNLQGHNAMDDPKAGALHMVPINLQPTDLSEAANPPAPPEVPTVPAPAGGTPEPSTGTQPGAPSGVGPSAPAAGGEEGKSLVGSEWRTVLLTDVGVFQAAKDEASAAALVKMALDDPAELPPTSAVAARQEPKFARGLTRAWAECRNALDMPALEAACDAADSETIITLLRLPWQQQAERGVITPNVSACFMRGVYVGAEPLLAAGVPIRRDGEPEKQEPPLALDLQALHPEAERYARAVAANLVVASDAVRARIRALIVRSIEQGIAPRDLARLIRNEVGLTDPQAAAVNNFWLRLQSEGVDGATLARRTQRYAESMHRLRALTIARTELVSAVNHGQQALWERAASSRLLNLAHVKRQWIVTLDERLCEICERLGESQPVGLYEPFSNGSMTPPAHPACRCAVGLKIATR